MWVVYIHIGNELPSDAVNVVPTTPAESTLVNYYTYRRQPFRYVLYAKHSVKKRERERLATSMKHMETEYNEAIEEERTRIAREMHDGPVQMMAHIGHKLEFVQYLLTKQEVESAQSELRQVHGILETCIYALRSDVSSLMTTQITPQEIGDALQTLLAEYQGSEPSIHFISTLDNLYQVPTPVIYPLFMFVQEALRNVRKHAHATEVVVHVYVSTTSLLAEVCDNGIGLNAGTQQHGGQHMGMRIMRERVQEVGGTVEFESKPGTGTCARAIFPLVVA